MKLFAVALSALAVATAPTVTTGPVQSVTAGSATVTGTVNPGGAATTYYVELGTSTAYGVQTAPQSAGDGTDPVPVTVTASGLTPSTTYHYRLVAINAEGTASGADMTFRTARAPAVASRPAQDIGTDSAILPASVNPEGEQTTVRFEYGTTRSYGLRTGEIAIGDGSSSQLVSTTVVGLAPYTLYHFRAVATNATGVAHGADRTFRTQRQPAAVSIRLRPPILVWGAPLTVSGMVTGPGAGGAPVILQRSEFPFGGPFVTIGTAHYASGRGHFAFTVAAMVTTARWRVVTQTPVAVASPIATATVAVKVGLGVRRGHHRHVRLTGTVWPGVPQGRATLERLSPRGRWLQIGRRHGLSLLDGARSSYGFTVRRGRSARTYRVIVTPHDGGAHARGTSPDLTLTGRR